MAFKLIPDITIIITMRVGATAGNCAQPACTKTSWENRVKGTVNVIAGCADESFPLHLALGCCLFTKVWLNTNSGW
jgi:hypothetical protein